MVTGSWLLVHAVAGGRRRPWDYDSSLRISYLVARQEGGRIRGNRLPSEVPS
jgi:hypothetical protein